MDELLVDKKKYDHFRDELGTVKKRLAVKRARVTKANEDRRQKIRAIEQERERLKPPGMPAREF